MNKFINEGTADRYVRLLISLVLFQVAYFWLSGIWQTVSYVLSLASLVTALTGFCGLYRIIGINTCRTDIALSRGKKLIFWLIFIVVALAGSYASDFFSRKFFLEDYGRMNNYYKQTLYLTGQEKRQEAIENYNKLLDEYGAFYAKYSSYHPYALKGDKQFNDDLKTVEVILTDLNDKIVTGDLQNAHLTLETVRPVFQEILKRNGFSMLAVALVDFHDSMEVVLEQAELKNAQGVLNAYVDADAKLKDVEAIANDEEIVAIRQKLQELYNLAKNNNTEQLPSKAGELKSSYVKVYLKRG